MKTLVDIAEEKLGTDFTDDKKAADTVSCAFALSTVLNEYLLQLGINFPICLGTIELDNEIRKSGLFELVPQPISVMQAGWITMCVTGTNLYPSKLPHGHCGIYDDPINIMSNDSTSGFWERNYTRDEWRSLFYTYGGYDIKIYKLKD